MPPFLLRFRPTFLSPAFLVCPLLPLAIFVVSTTHAEPPREGRWELVFADEFEGKTADLDGNWEFQNAPSTHILSSRWRENAVVDNGVCRLVNKKEKRGGQEWTSGSCWTKKEFCYGYFECRYKYAATTGLNNSFWIMTRGKKEDSGRFEIDINEGHYPNKLNTNIHNWSGKHWGKGQGFAVDGQGRTAVRTGREPAGETADLSRDFHVYGLVWNEWELIWYFDGREIRREPNSLCHRPAPVWLSSAVMNWAGKVTDAVDGTSMDVDYVRVYRRADRPPQTEFDFPAMLQATPKAARFCDEDYYIWCGSMIAGDDGKHHLLYSRWPRALGHNAWVTHSEVAHAVADNPLGPYKHVDVALPARGEKFWDGHCTHNPTAIRQGKKYYLYYMGNRGDQAETTGLNFSHRNNQRIGVAVADSPAGPWKRSDKPLVEPTPGFHDALCCTNPAVVERHDQSILMVYKAVGDKNKLPFGGPVVHVVATADSPTGPFTKLPNPVFTKEGVAFAAEDPFLWRQFGRYWAIVKDNAGHFTGQGKSLALFESADGVDWKPAKHPFVAKPEVRLNDGTVESLYSLERPQLGFVRGRPAALFCAADVDRRREHSFNIHLPLKVE